MMDLIFSDGRDDETRDGLVADQRGAIMVMGVFMAVILVGMIYYLSGIGETIVYRERMQDAADAGAFGAAVIHARGMNIIALLNIIMAAVLGVLVALKVLEDLALAALTVATAICAGCSCPGCCVCCLACPFVPVLDAVYEEASSVREAAEPPIDEILQILHMAEVGVREGYPYAAQAKVIQYGRDTYNRPTQLGFMYPFWGSLPVEDDDSDLLCRKAGYEGGRLAVPIPVVRRFTAIAVSFLARTFSSHYCGDTAYAQKVKDGLEMGDEDFQVRAFMIGDPPFEQNEAGVAVANWGRTEGGGVYHLLNNLGRVSFAQAEFYFDGTSDRDEWMWNMKWKARLRRFRLPGGGLGGISSVCSSGACGALTDIIDLDNIVVH